MTIRTRAALLAGAVALAATGAAAHHGWSWTADEETMLNGIIRGIYLGNPHAALDIEAEGALWKVELAPPSRTAASGFVEGAAAVGDEVVAHGHRSRDPNEKRMKAERIEVNGRSFNVYPGREQSS